MPLPSSTLRGLLPAWSQAAALLIALLAGPTAIAQPEPAFDVVVLGATGGIQDGNLSAFLIRPARETRGVTCDAGSLVNGIRVAEERGAFTDVTVSPGSRLSRIGHVLTDTIQGYLISHAHLDHVLGLVIASPDDVAKPVYALPSVQAELVGSHFNWGAWPNMTDRGKPPRLGKYRLQDLAPGVRQPLTGTSMAVTAYPLAHAGVESTAFLIDHGEHALLCLGDTGPDEVEKSDRLQALWRAVAERVKQGRLRAIIAEVSFTNDRPDRLLFGHLTPAWLMASLRGLAAMTGAEAVKGMPLVISHIKYSLSADEPPQQAIKRELDAANDLGLRIVIPQQGDRYRF
jgi:3',5'-cyclic-nucleotide phosphodiesterase